METNKKRLYQKPEIQEVKLVPEEAVLVACKAPTGVVRTGSVRTCGPTGCRASATGS